MILSDVSVRRPVAMGCLIIGLTLLGLNAYRKMGLELMPKMDAPFVTIVTIYPGASPGELETDVAKRIEDAVVSIDGLKHVTSTCMENGVSDISRVSDGSGCRCCRHGCARETRPNPGRFSSGCRGSHDSEIRHQCHAHRQSGPHR